jgi:cytochrome P450
MTADILDTKLTSQAFMHNPLPTLGRLLRAGPVVRVRLPIVGATWLAVTHEAVSEVLRDDRTFVRDGRNAGKKDMIGLGWWVPPPLRVLAENMLGHDNPNHRRLRKLVDQAFNRQSIESLRPRIAAICDRLLDRVEVRTMVDLVQALAAPLPLTVISELLGLPASDRTRFRRWVKALVSVTSLWGIVRFAPYAFYLTRYFRSQFNECRRRPRAGLMTALVHAEADGETLTENELLAMAFLLLVAGHETTVHLISGGILALLQAPEQKAHLLADWSQVSSAVEELLRFVSPVQLSKPRYVSRSVDFHSRSLERGEMIIPLLASANADPARFDHPERLDIARAPNPHVSFGAGSHFCLGAQLARVEAQIALEKLFTRFPDLALAVPEHALEYTGRLGLRALASLPVGLARRATHAAVRARCQGRTVCA